MRPRISRRSAISHTIALTAATAFTLVAVSGPASAALSSATDPTEVTVNSPTGLNVRTVPAAKGPVVAHPDHGERIYAACKAKGQNIKGNDIWYLLGKAVPATPEAVHGNWVSAYYVSGPAPAWCPGHGG